MYQACIYYASIKNTFISCPMNKSIQRIRLAKENSWLAMEIVVDCIRPFPLLFSFLLDCRKCTVNARWTLSSIHRPPFNEHSKAFTFRIDLCVWQMASWVHTLEAAARREGDDGSMQTMLTIRPLIAPFPPTETAIVTLLCNNYRLRGARKSFCKTKTPGRLERVFTGGKMGQWQADGSTAGCELQRGVPAVRFLICGTISNLNRICVTQRALFC